MSAALVTAEWTKFRTVRSTTWSLVAMVIVSIGLATLATSVYIGQWQELDAADRQQMTTDPIGLVLQPAATFSQTAICVLGAMVMASEYASGTITASFLAVPRRTPVLAAKALVLAAAVFVAAEVAAVASFFIGRQVLSERVDLSWGDAGVARAVLGFGIYLALIALFSLAIGALLRHVGAAIAGTLVVVFVLPGVAGLLPGDVGEYVSGYLPGGEAAQAIMSTGDTSDALLSPWQGIGVMAAWTVAALALAALWMRRRDVPEGRAAL
ncbi:ABC transporter permease [Streptomyces sp. RG80]|uniref:ABC transporter permease n=1 Tax=Streptomyces sp. RG80 TaxID=3157340 RepID=UPI00338D9144